MAWSLGGGLGSLSEPEAGPSIELSSRKGGRRSGVEGNGGGTLGVEGSVGGV